MGACILGDIHRGDSRRSEAGRLGRRPNPELGRRHFPHQSRSSGNQLGRDQRSQPDPERTRRRERRRHLLQRGRAFVGFRDNPSHAHSFDSVLHSHRPLHLGALGMANDIGRTGGSDSRHSGDGRLLRSVPAGGYASHGHRLFDDFGLFAL